MHRSIRTSARAVAIIALLLPVLAGAAAAGCSSDTPDEPRETAVAHPPALTTFELTRLPLEAEVQFTEDRVVWREGPGPYSSGDGDVEVMSFDIAGGTTEVDEWLTGLFAGRDVQEWGLTGDRVAWIEISERIEAASGGGHFAKTSVYTALRGESQPRAISPPAWGVSGDTGGYEPAAGQLKVSDSLISWYATRNELLEDRSDVRVLAPESLWIWDATEESRHRLPGSMDGQVLALGGRRVFTASGLWAATDFGSRTIHAWDADTEAGSTIRLEELAALPAVADAATLVWTVVPPDATDSVDADLAACDLQSGEVFTISNAPGGQTTPAVDGDLVVWVDTPLYYFSPLPDGSYPFRTLHGMQLDSRAESTLVAGPPHSESEDSDFDQVRIIGDRLFWTILDGSTCTVYGAEVVSDGEALKLAELGD